MRILCRSPLVLSLIASLLAGGGIIMPSLWPLAPVGLALFFGVLRDRVERNSKALFYGAIFGFGTAGAGTIWFWDTLPLSFLGIDNPTVQILSVGMTWCYVALSLAAPVPVAGLILYRLRGSAAFPLVCGLIWGLTEWGRMWAFALTTWAPQSLFGPHFSAAAIGYSLAESPLLLRCAHPFGIDGLNVLVGFAAGLAVTFGCSRRGSWAVRSAALQALVFSAAVSLFSIAEGAEAGNASLSTLRLAVIAEHLDTVRDESTHSLVLHQLTQAAVHQPPPDVILLPEELSLTSIFSSKEEYRTFIEQYLSGRDVVILSSRNEKFPAEEMNQFPERKKLVYDSTERGEIGRYEKRMLMPLGEYAPAFTRTFFSLISDPQLQRYLSDIPTDEPRDQKELFVGLVRGVRLGGLLCSDLFSPYLYRSLVREQGADLLVNLANQFWFHDSTTLAWKTRQIARVHAVQNRRPFVMANNLGPSLIVDREGAIIAESRRGARQVLYAKVEIPHQ